MSKAQSFVAAAMYLSVCLQRQGSWSAVLCLLGMLGRILFVTYQNCGSDSTGTTRENVNVDCPLAPPVITGTTMRTADEFTFAAAIGDCGGHRKQHWRVRCFVAIIVSVGRHGR